MGVTPLFAWPWPEYTDAADGSTVVKNLALAMDATVKQLQNFTVAASTQGRDMRFLQQTRRAVQSLPHNATTPITMDTTEHSKLPGPWTAKPEGWWLCSGVVAFSGNATGGRQVVYRKNASTLNLPCTNHNTKANGTFAIRVPNQDTGIYLVPADTLDIAGWQDSGVALSSDTAVDNCPRLLALYIYGPRP